MKKQMIQNATKTITMMNVISLILLFNVAPAEAKRDSRNLFPESYTDNGVHMTLQGVGSKSVVFIKAFDAALYIGESGTIDEAAKNLVVKYHVSIPGKKLNDYTIKQMRLNIGTEELQTMTKEINMMSGFFCDLKPGDEFQLRYIPDVGTKFIFNGELLGIIEGEEFAKAIYSVWIGDKPMDKKLKRQMLGLDRTNQQDLYAFRKKGATYASF